MEDLLIRKNLRLAEQLLMISTDRLLSQVANLTGTTSTKTTWQPTSPLQRHNQEKYKDTNS